MGCGKTHHNFRLAKSTSGQALLCSLRGERRVVRPTDIHRNSSASHTAIIIHLTEALSVSHGVSTDSTPCGVIRLVGK